MAPNFWWFAHFPLMYINKEGQNETAMRFRSTAWLDSPRIYGAWMISKVILFHRYRNDPLKREMLAWQPQL
jgi:hypothetical protein